MHVAIIIYIHVVTATYRHAATYCYNCLHKCSRCVCTYMCSSVWCGGCSKYVCIMRVITVYILCGGCSCIYSLIPDALMHMYTYTNKYI